MSNLLLYALSSLIWGSTWLAITFQLGSVPPSASVGFRFVLAGAILLLLSWLRGERWRGSGRDLGYTVLQGLLLFGVSYICVYEAETAMSSGLMAVLNSSMMLFNLLGMRLVFGKRFERRALAGAALGMLGIVLVFWPEVAGMRNAASLHGIAFGLLAAVLGSVGNLLAQRNHNAALPLLPSTALAMLVGGASALLITAALGLPLQFDWRPAYLGSLLYLSIFGSIIAFLSYFTLMGRIGAGRAGYIAVLVPILALLLSAGFEGFVWRGWTLAGIACAVLGNVLMLRAPAAESR
ncbi:DMT family transporter [Uliginosibacterium sediminicola]|uniref:EamA family transporter n=1 Tax=Uliginosibacterium sediminicola TaxID=2024550 RepID=A0ABU9YTT4_9RHOO